MMDYAGRVAQADTYPKMLRLNAAEHGKEIALRERTSVSGASSPGTTIRTACVISRWAWPNSASSAAT